MIIIVMVIIAVRVIIIIVKHQKFRINSVHYFI